MTTAKQSIRYAEGLLAMVAILCTATSLRADDGGQAPRTVRLSVVEGSVQLSQAGQPVTDQAMVNTPLLQGAQLSTGQDGRAEIQFEDGSVARIAPASQVTLTRLQPDETEIALNSGIGYFELKGGNDPFRVQFDGTVATALGFTVLRVKMDGQPGSVAVFSGNAHLEGQGGSQADLRGGESATLSGPGGSQFNVAQSIEPDSWDAWNSDRDQAITASESAGVPDKNIPQSNNPAWGDLSSNGTWYDVPDQGYVWSPYEASNAGWDPYGMGYWMWTPGYGYVWISGYRWGYLPYQCGYWRWYDTFGWGWAPGACGTWFAGGYGGGGFYETGWYFNVRNAPHWYRLPVHPGLPQPPDPKHRVRSVGPQPVIPVNRGPQRGGPSVLPPRLPGTPVNIAGRTVEPVHTLPRAIYHPQPVGPRPIYSGRENPRETQPGNAPRSGYVRAPGTVQGSSPNSGFGSTPASNPSPAPIARPAPVWPSGGGNRGPAPSAGGRPSSAPAPSSGAHPSGGPVSAPSGGGGHSAPAPSSGGGGHSAPTPSPAPASHK